MFKRKNKGEKTKEKKPTSKNKNWWKTGNWQGKIEEGRLHIYTWLMMDGADTDDKRKRGVWNMLKNTNIPGLEYWTLSKWRKVGSWKSGDSYTPQGNGQERGWHLRQPKIQAKKTEEYWKQLSTNQSQATLSVENKYEKREKCCDRRARKHLRDAKRSQSKKAVKQSKITGMLGQAEGIHSGKPAAVVDPRLETLYDKLSECMLRSTHKFGTIGYKILKDSVDDEYLAHLQTTQNQSLYYLTLLVESHMLELLCFDGPTGEQDNGLSSWLRELEGEKKLTIYDPQDKKSWKLEVSELLYTLYRALIYTYQERYLHRGLPGQSLTYIVGALEDSVKVIRDFKTASKIPAQLVTAFVGLSESLQSTISFIKTEREKIERGRTVNYFGK